MLTEYIDEALKRTRYELIQDEEPYYGEIKALPGIWASGRTLEECRRNLKEGLEGGILLSVKKGIPTPKLGRFEVDGMEQEVLEARAVSGFTQGVGPWTSRLRLSGIVSTRF